MSDAINTPSRDLEDIGGMLSRYGRSDARLTAVSFLLDTAVYSAFTGQQALIQTD